ncbi:AzlC family ABC transporter permease [Azorhizobium doebereinerae]|uniref:AzlC family ABC transporter permease n=1 Tax=Azorhizobium doebereinerae TaxID=281091 RepID=UPI0004268862|nr:AzlC family ABC transporter permease [Azorhizobium doebereinerae]
MLIASYIGFGGLLQGVGFPLLPGMLSTILIWALPAQVILVGGLAAGTALPAIALAVGLSSIRLLPMVVALAPVARGRHRSVWAEIWSSHYVAMTMWVEGMRLLPKVPAEGRLPYMLGMGNVYVGVSTLSTWIGFELAGGLPAPLAGALLFLTPASFTILMVRGSRTALDWMALGFGLVSAPLVAGLGGGMDLMIGGVGGGTLAYVGARLMKRRKAA